MAPNFKSFVDELEKIALSVGTVGRALGKRTMHSSAIKSLGSKATATPGKIAPYTQRHVESVGLGALKDTVKKRPIYEKWVNKRVTSPEKATSLASGMLEGASGQKLVPMASPITLKRVA